MSNCPLSAATESNSSSIVHRERVKAFGEKPTTTCFLLHQSQQQFVRQSAVTRTPMKKRFQLFLYRIAALDRNVVGIVGERVRQQIRCQNTTACPNYHLSGFFRRPAPLKVEFYLLPSQVGSVRRPSTVKRHHLRQGGH